MYNKNDQKWTWSIKSTHQSVTLLYIWWILVKLWHVSLLILILCKMKLIAFVLCFCFECPPLIWKQKLQPNIFFMFFKLVLHTQTGHRVSTAFLWEVIVDKPGPRPFQDADVSRTPSPQGQESERESQEGDSEARVANISTGGLITLSTLLLSGLLFEKHYSLTGHRLPGNYTAEGETRCTRPQQRVPKM